MQYQTCTEQTYIAILDETSVRQHGIHLWLFRLVYSTEFHYYCYYFGVFVIESHCNHFYVGLIVKFDTEIVLIKPAESHQNSVKDHFNHVVPHFM